MSSGSSESNDKKAVQARFENLYKLVSDSVEGEWSRLGPAVPPDVLFHYTTPLGFRGICDSKTLWLTDAFFLNDSSELVYGRSLAIEELESAALRERGAVRGFLETSSKSFNPFEGQISFSYYVASFCENGNLLSQWRAYGPIGAGFSLGFLTKPFADPSVSFKDASHAALQRVEYDQEVQRNLVRFAIKRCVELLQKDISTAKSTFEEQVLLSGWYVLLAVTLAGLFPQFKHPSFSEEREWRLTCSKLPHEEVGRLCFREIGRDMVPYITFPIALNNGRIPLAKVISAPGPETELRIRAVRKFLNDRGYAADEVSVTASDIPFRLR